MLALDIGTRSVIGVILKPEGERYTVVDYERVEHTERAMLDGQIHDIDQVTDVVRSVVDALAERNGGTHQAAIAAAGRTLVTERAIAEIELDVTKEIDKEMTDRLQMLAVQKAQSLIDASRNAPHSSSESAPHESDSVEDSGKFKGVKRALSTDDYYTVGHSIIEYRLDGALILNPHGHRGSRLAVEIIATFLPHIVVDSLYTVLNRADLEVLNLTLEPIAAMNVAIPKKLRLLNLALVDIGAGTSDIAISRDGTIHSYGMVAMAGDSITEVIANEYLLDFNAAEKLKITSSHSKKVKYTDVLGFSHEATAEDIQKRCKKTVLLLAEKIADCIVELNGKAPSAVFCIGGGSQLIGLKEALCKKLGLAKDRVSVKTVEQLEMISFKAQPPRGPEFITPVGIGVTAVEERDHDFIQVSVGGTSVRIFNTKNVQLSDALLLSGYNARSLLSERGPSIFVTVDGVETEVKGVFGEPAKLMVNGQIAGLDRPISHKDQIVVYPATAGEQRRLRLGEIVSLDDCVYLGDIAIKTNDYIAVGGINRTPDYILKDGDAIVIKGIKTVADLAERAEIDTRYFGIVQAGVELSPDTPLIKNTRYDIVQRTEPVEVKLGPDHLIEVTINGQRHDIPDTSVFVDLFDLIGFDTRGIGFERDGEKKTLELLLNGKEAGFLEPVEEGDDIIIRWKRFKSEQ
ncbi:MAG: cell division FtsA domain-containing protein [Bacillota bacterium]|nr:cell division FtsA domain-containing protein [Bacillota bacterium]